MSRMRGVQVWPPWWEQRQMVSEVRNKDDAPTGQEVGGPAMPGGCTAQARLLRMLPTLCLRGDPHHCPLFIVVPTRMVEARSR